jgi:hypothetical protein
MSSLAEVVLYQIVSGLGGVLLSSLVPAVQAAYPQADLAEITSTWNFYRAFGSIWGIAIPAAIFNSQMAIQARSISDPTVQAMINVGNAYAHVSSRFISSLPQLLHSELIGAYQVSLKIVWEVWLAFTALALLAVFAEAETPLKMTLESNYRLEGSFEQENKQVGHVIPLSSVTTSGI